MVCAPCSPSGACIIALRCRAPGGRLDTFGTNWHTRALTKLRAWGFPMRPMTLCATLGMALVALVIGAPPASASAPTRTDLPTGTVVLPDSITGCGFDTKVNTIISDGVEQDFVDRSGTVTRIQITGRFVATYTNLADPDQSITLNVSGPTRILLHPDGSFIYIANGPQGFFTGTDLLYNKGRIVADVSATGEAKITVLGKTMSICQALSG